MFSTALLYLYAELHFVFSIIFCYVYLDPLFIALFSDYPFTTFQAYTGIDYLLILYSSQFLLCQGSNKQIWGWSKFIVHMQQVSCV
jgi:hypothetical protein